MQKIQGWVEEGNTTLTITGAAGTITRKVQGSYPSATITVYVADTVTIAEIYSDDGSPPTAKANPFTAESNGMWYFYAEDGRYDVLFSGGGIAVPFTVGDLQAFDVKRPGNVRVPCPFPGNNMGEKIANAIADLPDTGGSIDARCFEGAQEITAPIDTLGLKLHIQLGAVTISLSTTMFTGGGEIMLEGLDKQTSIINYTAASGNAIDFADMYYCGIRDLTLAATSAGNTANGVYLFRSQHHIYENVQVLGFYNNFRLQATNEELIRTFNIHFNDVMSNDFLHASFFLDHSVDIYFTNMMTWQSDINNPTGAHAYIIDTGCSGVQGNMLSVIGGGFIVRNTMGTAAAFDFPPEFIHINQAIVDTVTGMPCFHFDTSLNADPQGRAGKSYRFEQSWSCFTRTDGMPGILIEGGENITFTDQLVRLNRSHGIHVTGGNNLRLVNPLILGNNQENSADIDGIHINDGVSNFAIIGGVCGNSLAGESGHQQYGIRVATGGSGNYIITGVDCSQGNEVGGIFDGSPGPHQLYGNVGTVDNGAGTIFESYDRKIGASARIELGDGGNFWEYKPLGADATVFNSDLGDYVEYLRAFDQWNWYIDSILRAALSGVGTDGARFFVGSGGNCYIDWKVTDPDQVVFSWEANNYQTFELSTERLFTNIAGTSITILSAGGLGIYGETDPSAALTITSTDKGLLLPRMSTAQRDAIVGPADGLLIYNFTTGKIQARAGGFWVDLH